MLLSSIFFVFFGCTTEPDLLSKEGSRPIVDGSIVTDPNVQRDPSDLALQAINHLQFVEMGVGPVEEINIWSANNTELVKALQKTFKITTVYSTLRPTESSTLWLILLDKADAVPKIPRGMRALFVLSGEWSQKELGPVSKASEGFVVIDVTVQRFRSSIDASVYDQALSIGYELHQEYTVPLATFDSTVQDQVHPSLWYLANPQWLEHSTEDPRVRVHSLGIESDPLLQLVQVTEYPNQVDTVKLTKHSEPWIRAQAFQYSNDWTDLQAGVKDASSVVRVVVADRVAKLLKEESSEAGCQIAHQFAQSSHAYERWKGAYALGFCRGSESVLAGLFKDVDIDVRRQAILSMGEMEHALRYWNDLITLTTHSNSFVRRWTWKTLGKLEHSDVLGVLNTCMEKEPSVLAKSECATALHQRGVNIAIPRYRPPDLKRTSLSASDVVHHPDPTYRKDAAKYLSTLKGGLTVLEQLLNDPDGEVRKTAVESLGYMKSSLVWDALTDVDPDVQVTALEAIRIGAIDGDCGVILPLLEYDDVEIRLRAVEALSSLEHNTEVCNEQLYAQYTDRDERIQSAVGRRFPNRIGFMEIQNTSLLLRHTVTLQQKEKGYSQMLPDDIMTRWTLGSADEYAWIQGIIQKQDNLCHEVFSWNDPNDKPLSHRGIRPPQFRLYGHPNRG